MDAPQPASDGSRAKPSRSNGVMAPARSGHAQQVAEDWSQRCSVEERDVQAEALRLQQQLQASLQSTRHLGDAPHPFRTAICFDILTQLGAKYDRFQGFMGVLQHEMARAVYVTPPTLAADSSDSQSPQAHAARVQQFFSQRTFFTQLQQVLQKKAQLQSQLDGLDAMHSLMTLQLRNEERMVDKTAGRWAHVVLRQTLVDWKKIIIRKKYTRVLLEKTSRRWGKQRLHRLFRVWTENTKASRVAKARDLVQHCSDQIRDFEELLAKMEAQIDSAKAETKAHREHYDFAKRQILSLEELLKQLEQRVLASNERKLQVIVNAWGKLCLAFVDCQLEYLQNMVDALPLSEYADVTLLLNKGEDLSELLSLSADALVLRWINFHVLKTTLSVFASSPQAPLAAQPPQQQGSVGFIQNFRSDMKNNYVLRHILRRILDWKERKMVVAPPEKPSVPQEKRTTTRRKTAISLETVSLMAANATSTTHEPAPFGSPEELRTALEELLDPSCPPFLSVQVLEYEMPSDMAFALFSFLVCEHPTLLPSSPTQPFMPDCPWKEAIIALNDARSVWETIRSQWTELQTPFAIREVAAGPPDTTMPAHLLVRANIALQNAVNMVQYACSKRSAVMKMWGCVQRIIQQDAMRVLMQRGRQQPPFEMMDRRMMREKCMLTTPHIPKLIQALVNNPDNEPQVKAEIQPELEQVERILLEFYHELRRVYRYYASIDIELQRTDHLLRQNKAGGGINGNSVTGSPRDAQEEERFFRKISTSMSLVEFHVFLKDCRVFGTARPFPYEFIERVFEQVNVDLSAPSHSSSGLDDAGLVDNNGSEMTPAEFVEALVHIAASKYVRLRHVSATSALTLAQRFRRLLVDVVLPNAMQEKERVNVFHEQLLSSQCREILAKHQKGLLALYAHFADLEVDPTKVKKPKKQQLISVNGLVVLLKHYELLRENFLNLDEVQHILSEVLQLEREGIQFDLNVVAECLAKLEDKEGEEHHQHAHSSGSTWTAGASGSDLLFLTFAEFLEVMAAVVCYLRPDAFVPLADKLTDFFSEELRIRHAPAHK